MSISQEPSTAPVSACATLDHLLTALTTCVTVTSPAQLTNDHAALVENVLVTIRCKLRKAQRQAKRDAASARYTARVGKMGAKS